MLLEDAYPPAFSKTEFAPEDDSDFDMPAPLLFTLNFALFACVCVPALIAALAFRGGLVLLLTGVTFVRPNSVPASRMRLFWRALVAWSLLLIACTLGWFSYRGWPAVFGWLPFGVFYGLALLSLVFPQRGLPDRLAGTWPVPR